MLKKAVKRKDRAKHVLFAHFKNHDFHQLVSTRRFKQIVKKIDKKFATDPKKTSVRFNFFKLRKKDLKFEEFSKKNEKYYVLIFLFIFLITVD